MNLIWHIVKKDLRAMKWPLALWTLLIVAKLGIGVALLTSVGTVNADWFATWFQRMAVFAQVLAGLQGMSFVLVAAVIHEDLLVGTTAFWTTRPISGARLLGAKILGIGLMFLVLPVLVTLPWWLGCGFGLREILWAALETLAVQLVCVLLGLLWSVVTDGFARFLLWTLVLLFAVPTISSVIGLHISGLKVKPTPDLLLTRVWVAFAIAVFSILVVTVHQFLTRRTWGSIGLLGAAAGLIIAVGLWWPWDWQLKTRWEAYGATLAEGAARIESAAVPAGLQFTAKAPGWVPRAGVPFEQLRQVQMDFSVTGIPESRVLLPQNGRYTLQWADGTTDSRYSYVWVRPTQNPFRLAASQSLGMPLRSPETGGLQDFTASMTLPSVTAIRAHAEKPFVSVKAVFRLLEFESATKFSLQPGARILTGALGERVAHVETMDGQILVTYVRSRPDLFMGDKFIYPYPRGSWPYSVFGLVNQAAGKFDMGNNLWGRSSRIASVQISLLTVAYGERPAGRKNSLPEAWLRDAELIRQTFTEDVRFSHEFAVGRLPAEIYKP